MSEYDKTLEAIEKLPSEIQPIAKSYIKDIEYWDKQVNDLQKYKTYEVDPKNPLRQRKLPAHDLLKEAQQQKINIQRSLVVLFKKNVSDEDDEFDKWISGYDEE
jgi:hypothetical protein